MRLLLFTVASLLLFHSCDNDDGKAIQRKVSSIQSLILSGKYKSAIKKADEVLLDSEVDLEEKAKFYQLKLSAKNIDIKEWDKIYARLPIESIDSIIISGNNRIIEAESLPSGNVCWLVISDVLSDIQDEKFQLARNKLETFDNSRSIIDTSYVKVLNKNFLPDLLMLIDSAEEKKFFNSLPKPNKIDEIHYKDFGKLYNDNYDPLRFSRKYLYKLDCFLKYLKIKQSNDREQEYEYLYALLGPYYRDRWRNKNVLSEKLDSLYHIQASMDFLKNKEANRLLSILKRKDYPRSLNSYKEDHRYSKSYSKLVDDFLQTINPIKKSDAANLAREYRLNSARTVSEYQNRLVTIRGVVHGIEEFPITELLDKLPANGRKDYSVVILLAGESKIYCLTSNREFAHSLNAGEVTEIMGKFYNRNSNFFTAIRILDGFRRTKVEQELLPQLKEFDIILTDCNGTKFRPKEFEIHNLIMSLRPISSRKNWIDILSNVYGLDQKEAENYFKES